ncbi:MAG: hypothetical protein HYS98_00020 [Deltaproteobacteria bacterium]|nr:hypothetical protein [Deltaproteobacteria bacterium]
MKKYFFFVLYFGGIFTASSLVTVLAVDGDEIVTHAQNLFESGQREQAQNMLLEYFKSNPFIRDSNSAAQILKKWHREEFESERKQKGVELYQEAYLLEPYEPLEALHLYEEALLNLKGIVDVEKIERKISSWSLSRTTAKDPDQDDRKNLP